MRVAFLDSRFAVHYGAQRSLLTLLAGLDRSRVQPLVLTTGEGAFATAARAAHLDVVILPLGKRANVFGGRVQSYGPTGKLLLGIDLLRFFVRAVQWLRAHRIDAAYANDLRSLLLIGPAARVLGLPVIWYVREDRRLGRLQGIGARLATQIITIADGVRAAFTPVELARHSRKFTTIYTGFDTARYATTAEVRAAVRAQLGLPSAAPVVGLVGCITPRKGHDLLVDAAPLILMEKPDTHFLFIGAATPESAHYEAQLRERIQYLGLGARVHWAGYHEDVAPLYGALDLLALPSRSEGLPRTLIEALAAGLPVVASDVGGVREILTSPAYGCVVGPDDSSQLARAICRMLDAPNCAAERCAFVRDRFSIAAYVNGFTRVTLSVFERDTAARPRQLAKSA
jgi:glycosyltransferase involved in cell wall biosynthesis